MCAGCADTESFVPPVTEKSREYCVISYNTNTYTATVTHALQGTTAVTFISPENLSDTVYSFTGSGCDIMRGELSLHTQQSYLNDSALPQRICSIFDAIQKTDALTLLGKSDDNGTLCIYSAETDGGIYRITAEADTGFIKEIENTDGSLKLTFEKSE